ncbi:tRNA lysidine(34) synthetase TilS [Cesiribacter sp. SM1]|uniref:tRNA lysidine(34) synthetase TilS n=1 Tax=Cesiribacter sp. SM1 TaxID=2861196 RepID=UPI001CD75D1C|nr:tRNA lysidine(34) synthetase TilS [Cesiribacter sp. SM1]
MQNFFLTYIKEQALFALNHKILLAVSGGLDSVVMAHLFSQSPYSFAIAHVNFGLRGAESEEDARFVESLAQQLDVSFYTTRLNAAETAQSAGVSIQMAARDLRYQWFDELCQQLNFDWVATAHHMSDQAETLLLNLSRGTGIAGLHGISAKRGKIVRPLLFATRRDLAAYAQQHGISWREDSSNNSLKYRRNKIRQQVMPVLKELNPRVEWAMQETAQRLRAAEGLLLQLVNNLRPLLLEEREGHFYLNLPRLLQETEPQYLLGELLTPFGGSWQEAGNILQTWQNPLGTSSGKRFSTATHRLGIDRQQLIISPVNSPDPAPTTVLVPTDSQVSAGSNILQTRRITAKGYVIDPDPAVAALDFHKLQFPLQLRPPQTGDWFRPLGMKGKKKLSDFMIDHKIPVNLKEEVQLVVSGADIVWVAGYRPDDRFKITPQTQEVFEIRLVKP